MVSWEVSISCFQKGLSRLSIVAQTAVDGEVEDDSVEDLEVVAGVDLVEDDSVVVAPVENGKEI